MTIGPVAAETTVLIRPTLTQIQSIARPIEFGADPTYSNADWPFISQINPDDYPSGTTFILEAIIDTDNASFAVSARLYNITDAIAVNGSVCSSTGAHLSGIGTRVRSSPFSLTSGDKKYRV